MRMVVWNNCFPLLLVTIMMAVSNTKNIIIIVNGFVVNPVTPSPFVPKVSIATMSPSSSSSSSSSLSLYGRLFGQQYNKFNSNNDDDEPYHQYPTIEGLEEHATDEFIDTIVNQVTSYDTTGSNGEILRQYKPNRFWLWKQWSGTVLQHGSKKALVYMIITAMISIVFRRIAGGSWVLVPTTSGTMPTSGDSIIDTKSILTIRLKVFNKIWHYSMTLTTFLLTFFVTQAYSFWRGMYSTARKIQGRLNDFGLLLATHTKRRKMIDGTSTGQTYTPEGEAFLNDISSYIQLFSPFLWASNSRKFRVLLTNRGMQKMVDKKFLSPKQKQVLQNLDVPRTQYYSVCLEWIIARTVKAMEEEDHVLVEEGQESMMHTLLHEACQLRAAANGIPDDLDGRMPLVYAHFVQILVDWFVLGAPLALFAELGSMSIVCVGILTLFYEGMLDLAKVFLDPLENEDYCDGGIEMDLGVLIRESNKGSIRWKNGAAELPF